MSSRCVKRPCRSCSAGAVFDSFDSIYSYRRAVGDSWSQLRRETARAGTVGGGRRPRIPFEGNSKGIRREFWNSFRREFDRLPLDFFFALDFFTDANTLVTRRQCRARRVRRGVRKATEPAVLTPPGCTRRGRQGRRSARPARPRYSPRGCRARPGRLGSRWGEVDIDRGG